jgi:SAM-dependent methyltransferase
VYAAYERAGHLGFAHPLHQRSRFLAMLQHASTAGRSVLDFGCGHADLYPTLCDAGQQPSSYHGVDLLPRNLARARRVLRRYLGVPLEQYGISFGADLDGQYDVSCCLSVLSVDEGPRTLALWRSVLEQIWAHTRDVMIFDLLRVEPGFPHPGHRRLTPQVIAGLASRLSRNHVIDNTVADHYSLVVVRREPTPTRRFWDTRR